MSLPRPYPSPSRKPSTSMLGRLFHTAASSLSAGHATSSTTSRPPTTLESVQEEIHTRNLLFPDPSILSLSRTSTYPLPSAEAQTTSATVGCYDDHGELELECPRDVRIIIAQDAIGSHNKAVLYDSRPPSSRNPLDSRDPTGPQSGRSTKEATGRTTPQTAPSSPRRHSAQRVDRAPPPSPSFGTKGGGAFQRARLRGASMSVSSADHFEPNQSRVMRENEDDTRALLDCVFGSAPLSYKGSSTKLHIIPSDDPAELRSIATSPSLGSGSFGRAEGRKRSNLAKSYTPSTLPEDLAIQSRSSSSSASRAGKRTVLITRMFSASIPEIDQTPAGGQELGTSFASDHTSYPFPRMDANGTSTKPSVKQRKTPMFAIAIVLHLPSSSNSLQSRMSSSFHGQESFPSSLSSEKRSGWTFLDHSAGLESISPPTGPGGFDERMDLLVQHWDVITRTLARLEAVVKEKISIMLQTVDVMSPQPLPSPAVPENSAALALKKKFKPPIQQSLQLKANSLSFDDSVKDAVKAAGIRILMGIRIPRVITGQGRWGVWREEARWVGRWAGGKEQNFFFFNLLTAFLGNHTEWLDLLGPHSHRRRHPHHKSQTNDDALIPSRTVIVANDKMAARRLIFLLSAFLPSSIVPQESVSPFKGTFPNSTKFSSPSPPTGIPILREESLRRQINRRANQNRPITPPKSHHPRAVSFSVIDNDPHGVQLRKTLSNISQVPSTRSTKGLNLTLPSNQGQGPMSSTATTGTVTPSATVPIPHFAAHGDSTGTSSDPRPGSSGSLASINLMHALRRNDSTDQSTDSQPASRWGSLMSGSMLSSFWSARRETSTASSEHALGSDETVPVHIRGVPMRPAKGKLEQMVAELEASDLTDSIQMSQSDGDRPSTATGSASDQQQSAPIQIAAGGLGQPVNDVAKTFDSPKLSVDEDDGVVDVDFPLNNLLPPNFGSPLSSPSTTGIMSVTSQEGYLAAGQNISNTTTPESDNVVDVAGWLKRFHEDFVLQAVTPYPDLEFEIKQSMRAEPTPLPTAATPSVQNHPDERWVDVCTTLVADAENFTIKRLRLHRRVQFGVAAAVSTPVPGSVLESPLRSQTLAQTSADVSMTVLEEQLVEEVIMDMDSTLVEAVERVLAQSGQSSKIHSAASSRSSSRCGRQTRYDGPACPIMEVPRSECKKTVLGALEQVVRSVRASREATDREGKEEHKNVERGRPRSRKSLDGSGAESTLREGVKKWLDEVDED